VRWDGSSAAPPCGSLPWPVAWLNGPATLWPLSVRVFVFVATLAAVADRRQRPTTYAWTLCRAVLGGDSNWSCRRSGPTHLAHALHAMPAVTMVPPRTCCPDSSRATVWPNPPQLCRLVITATTRTACPETKTAAASSGRGGKVHGRAGGRRSETDGRGPGRATRRQRPDRTTVVGERPVHGRIARNGLSRGGRWGTWSRHAGSPLASNGSRPHPRGPGAASVKPPRKLWGSESLPAPSTDFEFMGAAGRPQWAYALASVLAAACCCVCNAI
jgi:hypothetical protein